MEGMGSHFLKNVSFISIYSWSHDMKLMHLAMVIPHSNE